MKKDKQTSNWYTNIAFILIPKQRKFNKRKKLPILTEISTILKRYAQWPNNYLTQNTKPRKHYEKRLK